MSIFDKSHVRIRTPAVIFVCTIKIQIANSRVIDKFHIHAIAYPLVADMIGPKFLDMIGSTPHRFKAIATFDQMRVHIINRKIAVNVISRTFVTADYDRSSSQVGPTAHADKAFIGLCGNPVAPSLQIVGFLHDFKARFTKRTATIFFKGNSVELVRFSRHAVLFATSHAAPGAVLLVRLGYRITHLPKVISSLGHENCHRIRTLQVLANARRICSDHNFSGIATRR